MLFLLAFALFVMGAAAAGLNVIRPVDQIVNDGGEVYLGSAGPGQTVYVEADALVKTGGKFGLGGRWDRLEITEVPDGWSDMLTRAGWRKFEFWRVSR